MSKYIISLLLLLSFATTTAISDTNNVYICTGSKSACYHRISSCRGLSRCSGSVVAISKEKAVSTGKRPCKICYGN